MMLRVRVSVVVHVCDFVTRITLGKSLKVSTNVGTANKIITLRAYPTNPQRSFFPKGSKR